MILVIRPNIFTRVKKNGIDAFICGSLYDYGFAHDGNFAHQMHHRLFESQNSNGYLWRNDIVSINICRGREHGIQSYNAYREYCGLKRAYYFEEFGNTINYVGIKILQKLYKDPEDVDAFVGFALEDKLQNALIGRTSACLLLKQFEDLCVGDRFCVTHAKAYTKASFYNTAVTALRFILCKFVDIHQIPKFPFTPPDDINNILINCSDFDPDSTDLFSTEAATFRNDGSDTDGPSLDDLIGRYIDNSASSSSPDHLDLSG